VGQSTVRDVVEVNAKGRTSVADRLGDSPETVISVHVLRRGLCRAFVLGTPEMPDAAMLQSIADPTEPTGFGDDAADLWRLLRGLRDWTCVNVPRAAGPQLAALISDGTAGSSRLREDVYHVLVEPARSFLHPAVRRLTIDDRCFLDAAETVLGPPGWNWGSSTTLLAEGMAAGGFVDNRLVAIAFTFAVSARHADVSVATLPDWRDRGLATACAALVCDGIQAIGQTPVWSAGEHNFASLRVASKLGFVEVHRRVYVILAHPAETIERDVNLQSGSM
jgi:predicted GNAT family acetyltransferase